MLLCKEIKFARKPHAIRLVVDSTARTYSEEEFATALDANYEQGFAEAMSIFRDRQARQQEEILELQRQTLQSISSHHETLVAQFSQMLPGLVMEAVGRVLAVVEIDKPMITGIVSELLAEIHPGKGELEVALCERDLELLEGSEEMFRQKYPGISFVTNADLRPGDCMARSRFGTFDGRISTKLENVEALLQ